MKEIELSKHGTVNKGKYKTLVDDDVFPIVNQWDWTYDNGYAVRSDYSTGKKMNIHLHRVIWELKKGEIPEGLEVEHKDQNGLNNQISNLRLANRSENACNIAKYKNNTSGYKGIRKKVDKKKYKNKTYIYTYWYAYIYKNGKEYTKYSPFTDEGLKEAKEWIKQNSLELHKEFSIYNRDDKDK